MKQKIEIYVRQQSAGRNLLTMHIPENLRATFVDGISCGAFEAGDVEINVELSVQPEWVRDVSVEPVDVRIPISLIATSYSGE